MDDLGLMVVGSNPTSAPSTPTTQYNQNFIKHKRFTYADRLFGQTHTVKEGNNRPPSAQSSARSVSSRSGKHSDRSTPRNKKKEKHNQSYVDEMLFGPKPEEPDFAAPWDKPQRKPVIFDMTDYKSLKVKKAARPESASSKRKPMKAQYNPSFVDEGLFGAKPDDPSFAAPWNKKQGGSKLAMYDYGGSMPNGIDGHKPPSTPTKGRPPSRDGGRPDSRASDRPPSSRPSTPTSGRKNKNNKPKEKHNASFVDELLFGPKPVEPDFAAPWEKKEKKPRPFFCDASNSSQNKIDGQPGRTTSGSRSRPNSARSTTSTQDRPVWK